MRDDTAEVVLHLATPADADVILDLVNDAARWLQGRGVDQWPHPFPEEIVRSSVDRGETYLALEDGALVGSVAVHWEDARFWGRQPPDAGYVHRLVAHPTTRGRGLGAAILDAVDPIVRSHDREFVRLDTGARNWKLRRWYERVGFTHRGDIEVELRGAGSGDGPWVASPYERRIENRNGWLPQLGRGDDRP